MDIDQMFPSKYLRAADLTKPATVTIKTIKSEEMYKPGVGKITGFVLVCEKASKGIVLSKALATSISQALGEKDTNNWIGKQVILYPTQVTVAGVTKAAIRAKSVNGNGSNPA